MCCREMTPVGFEPTQLALVELESTPLDQSGSVLAIHRSIVFYALHTCLSLIKELISGFVPADGISQPLGQKRRMRFRINGHHLRLMPQRRPSHGAHPGASSLAAARRLRATACNHSGAVLHNTAMEYNVGEANCTTTTAEAQSRS
jgi:hypothetical protein